MPDAINHLSAFNRIAYALENLPEDDLSALVTALESIANKTIPVADMTGIVTAINNKAIPETDLTGVVTAINNISISGGGGASSGSLDCDCLADVLAPLIDKIDQMICVVAPIAAAQIQIQKVIAYIGMDGPLLGIDAPPGSFIFPVPGDSAPPITTTPWPDSDTPVDSTGAWTAPPVIDGVYYIDPPGGMLGEADLPAYKNYKCDMATYIFRYTRAWFESINAVPQTLDVIGNTYGAIEAFLLAVNFVLSGPSAPQLVYSAAAGGAKLVKPGATGGPTVISSAMLVLLALVIADLWALAFIIETVTTQYLAMYNARKHDLICALYKAKTVSEAKSKFMTILGENPVHASFWYDKIASYVLSDTFLSHLFACHPDFDPESIAGLGLLEGGCVDCILCADMDEELSVNQKSIQGYPLPVGEVREGLVPFPVEVDMGQIDSEVICVASRNEWRNGNAGARISINGVWSDIFWDTHTDTGAGTASTLESMPFKEQLLYPAGPATRFTGHVILQFLNVGVTENGRYEISTVSWRLP